MVLSLTINSVICKYTELQSLVSEKLSNTALPQWERDIFEFISFWIDDKETIEVQTSGTTGAPRKYLVSKKSMIISARKTLDFFNLKPEDTALLSLSPQYIAGKLMIVRAFVGGLNLILSEPSGTPLEDIDVNIDFAAMVPMQMQKQILVNPVAFKKVKTLIVGGGEVSPSLTKELQHISTQVWGTYGMTETLTHIALKKINGKGKSEWFTVLQGVKVQKNSSDCLEVEVDGITTDKLATSDIVEFNDSGQFKVLGRSDDVINSGGIKVMPSLVEKKIEKWVDRSFVVSSVSDDELGEKVVLVIESDSYDDTELKENLKTLKFYETPKDIVFVSLFPYTKTGKIKRNVIKRMLSNSLKPLQ